MSTCQATASPVDVLAACTRFGKDDSVARHINWRPKCGREAEGFAAGGQETAQSVSAGRCDRHGGRSGRRPHGAQTPLARSAPDSWFFIDTSTGLRKGGAREIHLFLPPVSSQV